MNNIDTWFDPEKSIIFFGFVGLSVGIERGNSLTRSTWAPLVSADDILNGDAASAGAFVGVGLTALAGDGAGVVDELTTRSPFSIFLIASAEVSVDKTVDVDSDVVVVVASLNVSSSLFFRCSGAF